MSTQTTSPAEITIPPDEFVRCPYCHQLMHAYEMQAYEPQELPRVLYKEVPMTPPMDPPRYETEIVTTAEQETKALGEGWQKDPPKAAPETDSATPQKAQSPQTGEQPKAGEPKHSIWPHHQESHKK